MRSRSVVFTGWCLILTALGPAGARAQDDPELLVRIEAPSGPFRTGVEFDASVRLDSRLDRIQGWSLGVAHDPEIVELLSAEAGATTLTVNNGNEPNFLVLNDDPANGPGITMAVVISFTQPIFLDAGNDYELLRMRYRVVGDPTSVEPCEPIESAIRFSDALGDPEVPTVLTVDSATRPPVMEEAPFTVRCPGTLEITRCEGDTENVYLEWTFGGTPSWDFLFLYRDGELLASLETDATSYDDLGLEPGDYVYTLLTFLVEDPLDPSLLFTTCTATVIPVTIDSIEPGIGYWVGGEEVTIRGTAFTSAETTTVTFFSGDEEPLVLSVLEVVSENELRALTPPAPRLGLYDIRLENERGSAELAGVYEYGFIRGEVNGDVEIDLSDAVRVLDFLFLGKSEDPPCLDAVDANDDSIHNIADAVTLLDFLFLGAEALPPPFEEPGADPTPDGFGCLEVPAP